MGRAIKREVSIHEYKNAEKTGGWKGYVEPKSKEWILFYREDGTALFYAAREANGGVIVPGVPSVKPSKKRKL